MTQATALIKFKHCNFGEHYAAAVSAYDTDAATAWVLPFTLAQRAYWAQQGGGLINGYAEGYATQRSESINNAASFAYASCMNGGATSAQVVETGFRLIVQTQLDGGHASSSGASNSAGLSTQLSVPFSPELPPAQDNSIDWRAFYRVGETFANFRYASEWALRFPGGAGFLPGSYATLPMEPVLIVDPQQGLLTLTAEYVPYIDAPGGISIMPPDDVTVDFIAEQSSISFTINRWVVLPDGQRIIDEVEFASGGVSGELSGEPIPVNFPPVYVENCEVSGIVDVYHFITGYAFGTLYRLPDKIQQVRVDGVDYEFTVPANAAGSVPPSYGPPGFNAIHREFYYVKILPQVLVHNPVSVTVVVMPTPSIFRVNLNSVPSLNHPLGEGVGAFLFTMTATDGFEYSRSYQIVMPPGGTGTFARPAPSNPELANNYGQLRPEVPYAELDAYFTAYSGGDALITQTYQADIHFADTPLAGGSAQEVVSFNYINLETRISAIRISTPSGGAYTYPVWTGEAVTLHPGLDVGISSGGGSALFMVSQAPKVGWYFGAISSARVLNASVIEDCIAVYDDEGAPGYKLASASAYFYTDTYIDTSGQLRYGVMVQNTIGADLIIKPPFRVL